MRWHVHFDGAPTVVAHVCDLHRAEVLAIPCDQCQALGEDCPHVQHIPCSCGDWPECDICADERALAG